MPYLPVSKVEYKFSEVAKNMVEAAGTPQQRRPGFILGNSERVIKA